MRLLLPLLLLFAARVRANCAACCAPGGSCDAAYKQSPGVCCGGGQCCPLGYRCASCDGINYRCMAPQERFPTCVVDDAAGATLSLVFFFACVACIYWQFFRPTPPVCLHPSVVPPPVVHGGPSPGASGAMGFLGGMLVGEMLLNDDGCSPPSYAEATGTLGLQADV